MLEAVAFIVGVALGAAVLYWLRKPRKSAGKPLEIPSMLWEHFHPTPLEQLRISTKSLPPQIRPDLESAFEKILSAEVRVLHFSGIQAENAFFEGMQLKQCLVQGRSEPPTAIAPTYDEVDIGDREQRRVLETGLWLIEYRGQRMAILVAPAVEMARTVGVSVELATQNNDEALQFVQQVFGVLDKTVEMSVSYRGKILSITKANVGNADEVAGIKVHSLGQVGRDDVILPNQTLELMERNVIEFAKHRETISKYGRSTKKGVLFYGPPGTGKTHTIHFLARSLPGYTTLLICAEDVASLSEYMKLARLLQPSMVVIEDVDLIARNRQQMNGGCEEVLLNKLLNEMDGLQESSDVLFVLTTNRPESLEAALAARPGRIDQAIEFPLPDATGREKLIRLYSQGLTLSDAMIDEVVRRTEGVSASFIKELMRRSLQFHLQDGDHADGQISVRDVDHALNEMLFAGGALNRKLLGATDSAAACN